MESYLKTFALFSHHLELEESFETVRGPIHSLSLCYFLSSDNELLVDSPDELVKECTDGQLSHLITISNPLADISLELDPLVSQGILFKEEEDVVLPSEFFVLNPHIFVALSTCLPHLLPLNLLDFFGFWKVVHFLGVLFHEIHLDIGFFADATSQLHCLDLSVHFSDLSLDIDSLLDAFLDDRLELSIICLRRVDIVLYALSVLTHLHLLFKSGIEAQGRPCDREDLDVEGLWLPHVLIYICHGLLRREQVFVEAFEGA